MTGATRPIKVLVAKPGLDGHDVGAKIVARALMDAGMEVVYTGLRRSPTAIAAAAVEEDVDVVGLSVLSGAHVPLTLRVLDELRVLGAGDATVIVGGNIPAADAATMRDSGVAGVFPTGTSLDAIVEFLEDAVTR
ncbi:MAG: cobalamin B12-binding domain-containing protein [Acidimicrobiia bacterium]